jgi:hypothetical protein
MNDAQVRDAWRVHRQREEQERSSRTVAARLWVAAHPELCDDGVPCPFAIDAALHYRRLGGPFDAGIVRRHRDLMVARTMERLGA